MTKLVSGLRMWAARNLSEQQKRQILDLASLSFLPYKSRLLNEYARQHPAERFDAFGNIAADLDTLRGVLGDAEIDYAQLPTRTISRPVLVIAEEDVTRLIPHLQTLAESGRWIIRAELKVGFQVSITNPRIKPLEIRRILCRTNHVAASGLELSSAAEQIIIEPWERIGYGVERVDGCEHIPGTLHRKVLRRNTLLEYLTPAAWERAKQHPKHLVKSEFAHIYEVTEPVDIVYTWVDGDDPEWRKKQQRALAELTGGEVNETAVSQSRYQSRDELKYSLRSVEYYASWVNHIYLVTDGQVPEWLNTEHPKITVVDHREIFSDPEVLPVFNSHAIESQLHHIAGLSNQYLYMNDDILFMRPVEPSLFYTGNGMSKFFPSNAPLDVDEPSARDMPVLSAAKRNRSHIETHFDRTVTNKFKHTPHPQLKEVMEEFETEHPELFSKVAASRFRHPEDYSIPSALYHYVAYAKRRAVDSNAIRYAYLDIASEDAEQVLADLLKRRNLDVLCVNDTATDPEQVAVVDQLLHDFLETRFPVPSSFEK